VKQLLSQLTSSLNCCFQQYKNAAMQCKYPPTTGGLLGNALIVTILKALFWKVAQQRGKMPTSTKETTCSFIWEQSMTKNKIN